MNEKSLQNSAENGTWQSVDGVWRRLHGSFPQRGESIEWHDFRLEAPLHWNSSFHAHSLEICLNYSGHAQIGSPRTGRTLDPSQVAVYTTAETPLPASLSGGKTHRFLTLEFSPEYLAQTFSDVMTGLKPEIRDWISSDARKSSLIDLQDLPSHLLLLREHFLNPPVPESARSLWFEGKIIELLASLLFQPGPPAEMFCKQHHRQNRELAEQMLHLLERDMANPPSLEMLATEIGRSPFHLSRIFSEVTGQSIPATLRKLRIERAAKLLRDTKKNVTEIAFEVGYSSLGAFNKAFGDQFQMPPGDYRSGEKPSTPLD
jgi:AraC-like DNA-binding protein